jgi:uncharacterized protein (DUF58 family)
MVAELIPPALRSHLKELRLQSRRTHGAQGVGLHASHSRGAGLEFSQYRPYEPGDALRQIDWKLYARADRFFVREAERESPLTVWLLIDASASMRQADQARPQWSRLDAAKCLAACIAELALRQGDRFGLMALHDAGLQLLPAGSGPRQRDRLWLALHALNASGGFVQGERLNPVWERIAAGDLVVLLSDCFDEAAPALAERLAAARRDVIVLQVLTAEERDFPFAGGHLFRDPESTFELAGDGQAMRQDYLARFTQALQHIDARLDAAGIAHARHVLDTPIEQALRQLFGRRAPA